MYLARVIGSVVSSNKDATMRGQKLLLVRPMLIDGADPSRFSPGKNTLVALDSVGAGEGDMVLFCQGSSARQAAGMKPLPTDAAIIGIVDSVDVLGRRLSVESAEEAGAT